MSRWLSPDRQALVAVLGAMALVVLDSGMVSLAVPGIARSLGVLPEEAIRIVTVYQGAIVAGLLPCAHLAGRYGERRLFLLGLVLFGAASCLCSLASGLVLLLAARAVQGLGGAAIMAVGVALLRTELGDHRLGAAIAWNALTVALCSAAAPIAGALVLSFASWPWLFLIKLPLAALAIGAAVLLPLRPADARNSDLTGILLHILFVVLVLLTMAIAAWLPIVAALAAAGATAVAVGILRHLRSRPHSIWPVDLLALRPMRIAVIASVCCFVAQSAGILALSFDLQSVLRAGPLAAGLVMACWPIAVAIASMLANRVVERSGSAVLCVAGGATLGAGLLLATAQIEAGLWPLAVGASLSGLGFGLFQVPNNRTMFLSAPRERSAAAGGVQGTARLVGQTGGALLVGALFANSPDVLAPRLAFALASLFAIAAAIVSGTAIQRSAQESQQMPS
jgi:DHA2 family multidrug resistance protein-like MFS transporter